MKRFGTLVRRGTVGNAVGWFAVWLVVGVALALLLVALVGLLVLPFAAAGVVVLAMRHRLDRSAWGLICGAGLLCLYVAYLQRGGPGTVAWHTATAGGAETYLDPRPWLAAGLPLVLVGVGAFIWRQHRVARGEKMQPG
jgi:hypothetical protein